MITNLVFTLVGVLFGVLVSWIFYRKSGKELTAESARLRRLSEIMLYAMEDAGLVKLNRNQAGEIVGRTIEAQVAVQASAIATVDATVIRKSE